MNWIDEILEQHKELESPQNFWRWSALAAISAVLRDNVYIDKYAYKLYPNIYVMLHAESGLRKGPPVAMTKQLVRAVGNTTVISGRSSIQGILKKLGQSRTNEKTGKIEGGNSAFICSSELGASLVEDKAVIKLLTDLYDRNYNQGDWDSTLKSENFTIDSPVVGMLTATNDSMGEDFITKTAIQGGLIARTFLINEAKRQTINSLMFPLKQEINYDKSADYLRQLAKLKGPIFMSEANKRKHDEWYHSFVKLRENNQIIDVTGTLNRLDDSILKVAILLSVSEQPELTITTKSLDKAVEICEGFIGAVRRTTLGAGKNEWAEEKAFIIRLLTDLDGHAISRQRLNREFWMRASLEEWDSVMNQLMAAGVVEAEQRGAHIFFVMPDSIVEQMKKHFRGK